MRMAGCSSSTTAGTSLQARCEGCNASLSHQPASPPEKMLETRPLLSHLAIIPAYSSSIARFASRSPTTSSTLNLTGLSKWAQARRMIMTLRTALRQQHSSGLWLVAEGSTCGPAASLEQTDCIPSSGKLFSSRAKTLFSSNSFAPSEARKASLPSADMLILWNVVSVLIPLSRAKGVTLDRRCDTPPSSCQKISTAAARRSSNSFSTERNRPSTSSPFCHCMIDAATCRSRLVST
mmetsp:Transcript_80397/g.223787  ORF Transcript_80397/g.223787 Transcript_80397/m.223787 type:complete len:236 (+) Transcript_80397:668-1375(+)